MNRPPQSARTLTQTLSPRKRSRAFPLRESAHEIRIHRPSRSGRGGGPRSRFVIAFLIAILPGLGEGVSARHCLAQADTRSPDRVTVRVGEGNRGRLVLTGIIEESTGTQLVIRLQPSETIKRLAAADVIAIETPRTEPHLRALQLWKQRDFAAAITQLEQARRVEERLWVRREILAQLVRLGLRQGDSALAGSNFIALVASDPTTREFPLIPLHWGPGPVPPETAQAARRWLALDNDVARLLGASFLLEDPRFSDAARTVFRELAAHTDSRLAMLAQAQSWRSLLLEGKVGPFDLERWHDRLQQMPEDLRAGPSYLLGRAYVWKQDYEPAAALLLWAPLVDDHDHHLAARSLLEAAIALHALGRPSEASSLLRELTRRFADTPFSDEARQLQTTWDTPSSPPAPRTN